MAPEAAMHMARYDQNYLGRVVYSLAAVCRAVSAEAAGPRQALAVQIQNNLETWAPRFGIQLVTLMSGQAIAAADGQEDIPVTAQLITSVFDSFVVK